MKREARGRSTPKVVAADTVEFRYEGLDGGIRRTRLPFEPAPTHLGTGRAVYDIALAPDERRSLIVAVVCEEDTRRAVTPSWRPTGTPAGPSGRLPPGSPRSGVRTTSSTR